MHEFSLDYLRCVACGSHLEMEVFCKEKEVIEGVLECKNCHLFYPIITKIPILWNNFSEYVSSRSVLGRKLFNMATHEKLKKFIKDSLFYMQRGDDRTSLEEKWTRIYQNSKNSKFYLMVKNELKSEIPPSNLAVEYGCSIGLMTSFLADYHKTVFGIDKSFSAISIAKKKSIKYNLDYFVADSLSPVFGDTNFDIIIALNVLELIEPLDLLNHVSKQIKKGYFVISDPYDFDRGKSSVKKPLDETSLRKSLIDLKFSISKKTRVPSYHAWNLKIGPRTTLNYKVDLVLAKKRP